MRITALFAVALATGCAGAAPLPPKALELNAAGVSALAEGDLETADARFAVALEYNPRFVEALTNLALVDIQRGNFRRARRLLRRAEDLNPDVAQPHHGLGVLAEREARPDLAAEHYRDALRVDPGFAPARANLGRLLFAAGQVERARMQFKRLVEVAPEEPLGHTGLAECLLRLGRHDEADQVVALAREYFGALPELDILHARSLLRQGRPAAAVALLTPIATTRSDHAVAALSWLATAELMRNDPRRAARLAQRALALDPGEPVATYALALALAKLEAPSAARWLRQARRLSPGHPLLEQASAALTGD